MSVRQPAAGPRPETGERSFTELIDTWLPLTYALNAVNRSMGRDDLYPFTLTPIVMDKLRFVHDRVLAVAGPGPRGPLQNNPVMPADATAFARR